MSHMSLFLLKTFKEKKDDEAEDDFDSDEEIKKILGALLCAVLHSSRHQ